jgi:hypothetical protein
LTPFFYVLKKVLSPEKIFHPPARQQVLEKNKIRARDQLIEKINTSKKF